MAKRVAENPIITPEMVKPSEPDMEVVGVFNPGAARYGDEVVLLLRVAERPILDDPDFVGVPMLSLDNGAGSRRIEVLPIPRHSPLTDLSDPRAIAYEGRVYLSSISHLRLARSKDGIHFTIDEEPTLFPETPYEEYGIEDCRITQIDGVYYLCYTAVSRYGISVGIARTEDFKSFQRLGLILHHENKNVVLFPRKIKGRYAALHRTAASPFNGPNMWLAYSPDLLHWGDHRFLMAPRIHHWDSRRIGAGAPPVETPEGWIVIYHGVNAKDGYCAGVALLDLEEPHRVISRSHEPLIVPTEDYEVSGFFERVVFPTGLTPMGDGRWLVYYGVADRSVAVAETTLEELISVAKGELVATR
ncbi:MAG: glycoside hydrolase family 130 protein [Armatimonadota bacterium]|nr:glycoside hydrolase family 130 protein [Armatimonadota bacterium]